MLEPLLGESLAPTLFAIALIAAGQSSTITGTLAGQIVMEGYLDLRIAPWLRRLITRLIAVVPAVLVILHLGESKVGDMLIFSQIILSLQLGFAIIPLIHFVSDKSKMGNFAIGWKVKSLAWLSAAIIVGLNLKLVGDTLIKWHTALAQYSWIFNFIIIPLVLAIGLLLVYILYYAITNKNYQKDTQLPHGKAVIIPTITKKEFQRVAICVDFTANDVRAITEAVALGSANTTFYIIHIVETAGAKRYGKNIQDLETREDWIELKKYGDSLRKQNIQVVEKLGFGNPKKQIPKICDEVNAELLVIGQHGHTGIMDIILGETISEVRHNAKCPVMVV
jgi:manganese transport protein